MVFIDITNSDKNFDRNLIWITVTIWNKNQMAYSSVSDELQEEFNPKKEEKEGSILEVGDQAVWSLSSCKAGKTF